MSDRPIIRVSDVMEFDYILIDGLATVAEALRQMGEQDAHFVIVKKRTDDDEFGMLLVSDIAKHVLVPHKAPDRVNRHGHPLLRAAVRAVRRLDRAGHRGR